ncbi:hypothetical protein Q7P35_005588 [Cladosporium inversicolor]
MVTVEPVRAGLIVSVTKEDVEEGKPTIFTAKQIPTVKSLPDVVPARATSRQEISWSFGPVKIIGYIDTETLEIGVEVDIFGAHIFNLFGNLRDGVIGRINLALANGEIKFLLKNENEVWVHLHLDVVFDGNFDKDEKIFEF